MATKSAKSKALLKMSRYEKKSQSIEINLCVWRKILDGKEITVYAVKNYNGGSDLPKEYTDIDNFINDCVIPNIKSFSKKIGL